MIGLRQQASNDAEAIMKETYGFVWPCVITSPGLSSVSFSCRSNDIHITVDAGTGEIVTGRQASIAILISDLVDAGFTEIGSIAESTSKPWAVAFDDINGRSYNFKVAETFPDYTIGIMICILEVYNP